MYEERSPVVLSLSLFRHPRDLKSTIKYYSCRYPDEGQCDTMYTYEATEENNHVRSYRQPIITSSGNKSVHTYIHEQKKKSPHACCMRATYKAPCSALGNPASIPRGSSDCSLLLHAAEAMQCRHSIRHSVSLKSLVKIVNPTPTSDPLYNASMSQEEKHYHL